MDQQLVDLIYESSFVPEQWSEVMDRLARLIEAPGGAMLIYDRGIIRWTASPRFQVATEVIAKENWFESGRFMARYLAARHAGFLVDSDLFTPEEMDAEPIYRDFWRPAGYGCNAGTAIPMPTGENIIIGINRRQERGPVERELIGRLDELRPHIARSALVSARLQLARARAIAETLALIGQPALVLDDAGKVLAANQLIEAMTGCLLWRARDRVALMDPVADKLLREAVETLHRHDAQPPRSFPLRDPQSNGVHVAHLIPIRRSARDIFVRCAAVMILTPVGAPQAPEVELIQSLFDLTPAEARVARSLVTGKTLEEIASDSSVSRNTVRTHLRGVLEKTGCNRQAEVVALLGGVSPIAPGAQF